jgi:hypothetical protein
VVRAGGGMERKNILNLNYLFSIPVSGRQLDV